MLEEVNAQKRELQSLKAQQEQYVNEQKEAAKSNTVQCGV